MQYMYIAFMLNLHFSADTKMITKLSCNLLFYFLHFLCIFFKLVVKTVAHNKDLKS